MSREGIAWDACGLLNLMATERAPEILSALSVPSFLVRQVKEREVLYLRPSDPAADPTERREVNVDSLIEAGNISLIEMTAAEQALFVNWASMVDDGEAYTLAVAEARGWQVATDDRATINYMNRQTPPIRALTTPEWLKHWSDAAQPEPEVLKEAIEKIVRCARYQPYRTHPLQHWWEQAK